MARQAIDSPNEIRVDGDKPRPERFDPKNFQSRPGSHGQEGPAEDGTIESAATMTSGYIGAVPELERNDDTRHPSSKIWVRRDRKPNAYLHTGNG